MVDDELRNQVLNRFALGPVKRVPSRVVNEDIEEQPKEVNTKAKVNEEQLMDLSSALSEVIDIKNKQDKEEVVVSESVRKEVMKKSDNKVLNEMIKNFL